MNQQTNQLGFNFEFPPLIHPSVDDQSDQELSVRRFTDFSQLYRIAAQWDELLAKSETNTVHQLFDWNEIWWRHLRGNHELFVIAVYAGQRLVGVAPLMRSVQRKHGRKARVIELIGSGTVNYLDFIAGPGKPRVLQAIIDALLKARGEWDALNLLHIPETSSTPEILRDYLGQHNIRANAVRFGNCPAYVCTGDMKTDLKITKKKTEQRYYNHYCKSGKFEFKVCASIEDVEEYLPHMFDQHIARSAVVARKSKYEDKSYREFVREMTQTLMPMGIPVFTVALFNDQPIAIQYGFHYAGKFTGYLLTHDSAESKNCPGRIMVKLIMEEMIGRGVTEFDFGRGAEEYKLRYTNCIRQNVAITAYNDPILAVLGTFSNAKHDLLERLRMSAKTNDSLKPLVTTFKRFSRLMHRCLAKEGSVAAK